MVRFSKFKFLYASKWNFYGGQLYKKYQNLDNSKSGKKSLKSVKLEVKNVDDLGSKVWNWKLWTFVVKY